MSEVEIECPKCGKKTVIVEKPDEYEVWLKCTECDLFLGMSADDWHRIHNSPNIDEKVRKLYTKMNETAEGVCRACGSSSEECGIFGICSRCFYKLLVILLIIMVIGSYMAWMALL